MRNLRNIRYVSWRSPIEHKERQITAAAWDTVNDSVICAYGPSETDTLIELVRVHLSKDSNSGAHELITSWNAPCPNPDLSCDQILSLQYFVDTLTACLVLAGGDIIVVRVEPQDTEDQIEIVGSVDAGISAAKWSPDGDLLAICTKADTFLFMSRSFEGVMDMAMTSEDLKASNHVSVGWGKKETQFKGKGAKALRDPTMPEKVDEGTLSTEDNGVASISWRGDGAFVALCTIEADSRRIIRVYSREGELDSVSEPVNGLEAALSWRPAGNLIAGIQRLVDRMDVVFFERNGLRHGQFSLRLTQEELTRCGGNVQLSWNQDSSVLAVVLVNSLQLWTMGNYHWYLKQEVFTFQNRPLSPQRLTWHPEAPIRFVALDSDKISVAEYIFSAVRSSTSPPNDCGAVAVIDGNILKITPLRTNNIPPPMALYEVNVLYNILDAVFSSDNSSIAILHQSGISIYSWEITPSSSSPPVLINLVLFKCKVTDLNPQQICFNGDGDILTLHQSHPNKSSLQMYSFSEENERMEEKAIKSVHISTPSMISSFELDGLTQAFAQGGSGGLLSLSLPVFGTALTSTSFPSYLPWVEVMTFGNEQIAFGMSNNGHLFANSRLLLKNCTSFLVTPLHLIFTTTTHFLKFVHMANTQDLEIPPDDPEADERCRSIERGARLVTAMPSSLSLILQMPRGNLETIWPRAMVLAGIRKLIDERNYRKAFLHCRTQRVDVNILYDHAPEHFMLNVGLFVDQIKKVTYVDLFLSSLREEDVTQTMYKETRRGTSVRNGMTISSLIDRSQLDAQLQKPSKVNYICDAIIEVLKTRTTTNLQNIITANVCKLPPALEDGLLVVAKLMDESEALAEKAVEHICFLADANKLYDTSLGLYNLDLSLLVAQQSQKDPREYLPFLQKLQEMSAIRRQFAIDDHLERYSKALSHLYELSKDDHSELETYMVKHALYKDALMLYRYQPARLESIMGLYANYLESQSKFHEAATAYEYLRVYGPASICYQRASPSYWRETIFCASQQSSPLSEDAFTSLVSSLAESLTEAKDFESAAYIYTNYLSSIVTAISQLCKGFHFASALQLASLHSKEHPELLSLGGPIDTGLADAHSASTELLAECKAQLLAQVPRIRELHIRAEADPLAFYEGEVNEDLPDDISVAASSRLSTSASLFTRYTGRQSLGTAATGASRVTSKNRRREERKRARGKKGSVYEEEYLVASVQRLMERVESVRGDVGRLVAGLFRRRMREQASAIEGLYEEVLDMCRKTAKELFVEEKGIEQAETGTGEEGYRPVGGDAVFAESLLATGKRKLAPFVGDFEKLTLLGA